MNAALPACRQAVVSTAAQAAHLDRPHAVHRCRAAHKQPVPPQQPGRHVNGLPVAALERAVHGSRGKVGGEAVDADALGDGVERVLQTLALRLLPRIQIGMIQCLLHTIQRHTQVHAQFAYRHSYMNFVPCMKHRIP